MKGRATRGSILHLLGSPRLRPLGLFSCTLASAAIAAAQGEAPPPAALEKPLEVLRERHGLPALAAAVVREGRVVAIGASGERKLGSGIAVTREDRFHLGSCTKAMTATLIATLVEEGKLSWESTIAALFPELAAGMRPEYRAVTLVQLLSHRAGLPHTTPAGFPLALLRSLPGKTLPRQRVAYLKLLTRARPLADPGTRMQYSNAGYVIAGAMAERAGGKAWEALMRARLFKPLGMRSAGFGAMARPGEVDQPWSHRARGETLEAVSPGPLADNPAVIGPAGTVHCSIGDWARFLIAHLEGRRGGSELLGAVAFEKLQAPVGGSHYALGWAVVERGWAGGKALTHAGSNTMNYAVVWASPARRFGVLIATNAGGAKAPRACDEAAAELIARFGR